MADADRIRVSYEAESAFGVIAATTGEDLIDLRITSESLRQDTNSTTSQEIRSDRQITDVVRRKVKGEVPTRFDLADQQIDIKVELEEEDRATLARLKRLTIPGPGGDIRLDQVASIKPGLGPANITRSESTVFELP